MSEARDQVHAAIVETLMASTETRLDFDAEATTMLHALLAEVYEEGFQARTDNLWDVKLDRRPMGYRPPNPYREDTP